MNPNLFWPLGAGALALLFVVYLTLGLLKKSRGNDRMIEISIAIQEGAKAFLKREYFYVAIFVVVIGTFITIAGEMNKNTSMGWPTALAFVFGAICSALTGYIGMSIATRANCRTTQAAAEGGTPAALGVAISGGAVIGMSVVGISVIGLVLVYYFASYLVSDPKEAMSITNGFAMGASLMALFARSGGGIYTKGADMGADLVGKLEAGIPEDDPRNPATIADNVGDNVGDVAGLGADLMESYVEAMIAAMAICAVALNVVNGGVEALDNLMLVPLMIATVGIVASIIGVQYVKVFGKTNPQSALMMGTYVAAGLAILGSAVVVWKFGSDFTLSEDMQHFGGGKEVIDGKEVLKIYGKWGIFWASVIGVISVASWVSSRSTTPPPTSNLCVTWPATLSRAPPSTSRLASLSA